MPVYTTTPITDLPPKIRGKSQRKRVVLVTNPHTTSLEMIGPVYALHEANFFLERAGRSDLCYDVEVVATETGSIFELRGLKMVVDTPYHRLRGTADTVIFQGTDEGERSLCDRKFISWVQRVAGRSRRVASVCVGAFVLAQAGLLDGRRATTHWMVSDEMQRRFPKVDVQPDAIYIRDGSIYTSAGATAGMDMTVALIEADYGKSLARAVAQGLVMYMKRPGGQAQFSVHMQSPFPEEERIGEVQQYVAQHPEADLSVEGLARVACMSPRNFSRVFARELGMTPGRYVELARLELARKRLEESKTPIAKIARQCGYKSPDGLRVAFDRHVGVSPREYRRRFATTGVAATRP